MTAYTSDLSLRAALACSPPRLGDPEEAQWIVRARAGEDAAFRWLLDRYRGRVVRLAAHVLRREVEAEDVAQEAFVRAFRHLHTLRGDEAAFGPWLRRIVVRLCLDRRRHARWDREVFLPETGDWSQVSAPVDTRLVVEALLDQLSPPLRAALVLREMEGLDYDEIADTLQIPVGTVRSRLNAARARFRFLWLEAHQEEETPDV